MGCVKVVDGFIPRIDSENTNPIWVKSCGLSKALKLFAAFQKENPRNQPDPKS